MPRVLALGFFDGIHIGHAALLRRALELARQNGFTAAVCTLDRSPSAALGRGDGRLLNTPSDRRYIAKRWFGIDEVFELKFDENLQNLDPREFIPMLVRELDAAALVAGYSYRYGARAAGNSETLRADCARLGLDCEIVEPVERDGEAVSSTRIRALIESGETLAAAELLGHPHILGGTVEHGRSLGHTLGFPTANVPLPDGIIAPKYGVYAVRAVVDGERYGGVANVGEKPTVGGARAGVEANIFGLDRDIYGEEIVIEFGKFLRPERKFDSIDELKSQVLRDKETARRELAVG